MRCADVGGVGVRRSTPSSRTRPALRIVEALGELEEGGLARARRADHGEPLVRAKFEVEIVERATSGRVG